MRKYLTAYLEQLQAKLDSKDALDYEELITEHLRKIEFMQHERLIHLLVTMMFTLSFLIMLGVLLMTGEILLILLLVLALALLIPYIWHYYFLENSVQRMYKMYDELNQRRMQEKRDR